MSVSTSPAIECPTGFKHWAPIFYRMGLGVFPCKPSDKDPYYSLLGRGYDGKAALKPYLLHRVDTATLDRWIEAAPNANPAIALGLPSCHRNRYLFVVDVEDFELFEEMLIEVEYWYGETLAVKTGRGGHIYLWAKAPIKGHRYNLDGKEYEIRGQGQYVMAAGAIHPSGAIYEIVSRVTTIAEVTGNSLPFCQLEYVDPADLDRDPLQRGFRMALKLAEKYNQEGITNSSGETDKSRAQLAIVLALRSNNMGKPDVGKVLRYLPIQTHFQRLLEEKGEQAAQRSLDRAWAAAGRARKADSISAQQVLTRMESLEAKINDWPTKGRDERTEKKVFLAYIAACKKAKQDVFFLSVRDGSEKAQCASLTFSKATSRLIHERRWLVITKEGDGQKATFYRISDENFKLNTYNEAQKITLPEDVIQSGVFEDRGFGSTGRNIYEALQGEELTMKEIIQRAGVATATAYSKVAQLTEHGLVEKLTGPRKRDTRYLGIAPDKIDFIAIGQTLNTAHIVPARRARNVRERHQFRARRPNLKVEGT